MLHFSRDEFDARRDRLVVEMAERKIAASQQAQAATDRYIQSVAGRSTPADQIASAKALLDDGAINQGEYEQLKAKALT